MLKTVIQRTVKNQVWRWRLGCVYLAPNQRFFSPLFYLRRSLKRSPSLHINTTCAWKSQGGRFDSPWEPTLARMPLTELAKPLCYKRNTIFPTLPIKYSPLFEFDKPPFSRCHVFQYDFVELLDGSRLIAKDRQMGSEPLKARAEWQVSLHQAGFIQYLDAGVWHLAFYNDGRGLEAVSYNTIVQGKTRAEMGEEGLCVVNCVAAVIGKTLECAFLLL